MKKKLKVIFLVIVALLLYCLYGFFSSPTIHKEKINTAYSYAVSHNMNTDIILFCDFGIHSGKKRFMVYDTKKHKVILSSLCAQGIGNGFSNKHGSYCSSLGFYKVGDRHKMSIGCNSYILKGLSTTNSNALSRGILIHPYFTVSDIPVYPLPTLRQASRGCFVLSPIKFRQLSKIIDKDYGKPILLYAYQ